MESGRSSKEDLDAANLALLGKKQVLRRRFGIISITAFATCELVTWETVLELLGQGFNNGGPAGLVYGFLIAWLSTLSVYTVISELASMAPIAGGQYYWVYILAPPRYKVFASYIIGWLTTLAWVATVATESIFAGTIVQGILILDYPNYVSKEWQGTLLCWLVLATAIFINVVIPNLLPRIETFTMTFHVVGFITVLTLLWVYSPHGSAEFVFTTSINNGGWSTQGLSYCVGFLGNVATFVGADASVHMAEEVSNAALNIPRAICASMILNGIIGFVMMLTVLFCLGDPETVLGTKTDFPFIQVFADSMPNIAGATVLTAILLILTWNACIGITTTASRMTWSFARDRGLPFSKFLSKVESRTDVPAIAVGVVTTFSALLALIYIGSSTAFNDVISLTITGFYGSYFLPALLLLFHRVKGNILPNEIRGHSPPFETDSVPKSGPFGEMVPESADTKIVTEKASESSPTAAPNPRLQETLEQIQLSWGPWHLPKIFGIINNAYACCYMVFVIFWSFWPPATPVTAESMNYSVLVTGGVIIFSIVWYWIKGRHEYTGPTIDDEVKTALRLGSIAVA